MIFKRVLNNNTAIATNHDGIDVLVMAPASASGKNPVPRSRWPRLKRLSYSRTKRL